jgi:hypothetical protein
MTTAAAALILAPASTAVHTFNYTPVKGDITKYSVAGELDLSGTKIKLDLKVTEEVMEITDGIYKTKTMQSGQLEFGGSPQPYPESLTFGSFAPDGRPLTMEGSGVDANAMRIANLSAFVRPDKDVQVGESWSVLYAEDKEKGATNATAAFKLVALESVNGENCLKVEYSSKENDTVPPAAAKGIFWISTTSGKTVRSETEWIGMPAPGVGMPISGKFTQTLIK